MDNQEMGFSLFYGMGKCLTNAVGMNLSGGVGMDLSSELGLSPGAAFGLSNDMGMNLPHEMGSSNNMGLSSGVGSYSMDELSDHWSASGPDDNWAARLVMMNIIYGS